MDTSDMLIFILRGETVSDFNGSKETKQCDVKTQNNLSDYGYYATANEFVKETNNQDYKPRERHKGSHIKVIPPSRGLDKLYKKTQAVVQEMMSAIPSLGLTEKYLKDIKGDYDRTIEDYTKSIELDKNDINSYYNRGIAYDDKGDYEQAIEDYNEVIKLSPNHVSAFFNRGVAYKNKGDYAQAIESFKEVLKIDPNDARAKLALEKIKGYCSNINENKQLIERNEVAKRSNTGDNNVKVVRTQPSIGRNDPCPCGSGMKYKHCHGNK